ncbi:hypothetical protein SAY87_019730 [Trapa incisa]|uniref:Uncharacterized protein n=1 Tax=Trapa incisa TaxID=236973 RepID=A0AAN7K4Y0_9MYRT|nr:hypothetical protein SAY87_019730 [Trapa incisa]
MALAAAGFACRDSAQLDYHIATPSRGSLAVAESCTVSVIGGGCPNLAACTETCRPCYIGNGQIRAFCQPAGGGIPYDQCICSFYEGAPCIPRGCPKQPPLSVTTSLQ